MQDEDRGNVAQECTGDSCSALGVVDSSVNGTACFEATLGRMKWQGAPGCNAGTNSPVVDGDSVYQACTYDPAAPSAGGLFRLAQDTGAPPAPRRALAWSAEGPAYLAESLHDTRSGKRCSCRRLAGPRRRTRTDRSRAIP